ncbi:uncharacterized protein LOC116620741 [Nematostella vectensis]|uniref:uncharacterized protein LOC116620741 n=1 Tax=Nematostella vectensis TaxID=45351 RepID=UPI00138FE02F|nr:uncharacterized protein LOC116620741 [Nematostella vectensis]
MLTFKAKKSFWVAPYVVKKFVSDMAVRKSVCFSLVLFVLIQPVRTQYLQNGFSISETSPFSSPVLLRRLQAESLIMCAMWCNVDGGCEGAGYQEKTRLCSLLKEARSGGDSAVKMSKTTFIRKVDPVVNGVDTHSNSSNINATSFLNTTSFFCKTLYERGERTNKSYPMDMGASKTIDVYCQMTDLLNCGGGGWTLVMKIDGSKSTFGYEANYWTDEVELGSGGTGQDVLEEAKLPTYWNTPFTKICVGMRQPDTGDIRWLKIDKTAVSMLDLLSDNTLKETNVGIDNWKGIYPTRQVLQTACQKEGFNMFIQTNTRARIGVIGDDAADCSQPDSTLGLGTQTWWNNPISCGSAKRESGEDNRPTWCFLFVQ